MARANSIFPLTLRKDGRFCKVINGRRHYFGYDRDAALAEYLRTKDYLKDGRLPPARREIVNVRYLCNHMLTNREADVQAGVIRPRTYDDLKEACIRVIDHFGPNRDVSDIRPDEFAPLRKRMADRYSVSGMVSRVATVRQIFNYGYKNDLIEKPVKFGTFFSSPKRAEKQKHANQRSRVFKADEIRQLLDACENPHLKAMILLGVNAGYGNADCKTLQFQFLDLENAWASMPRVKNGNVRRAKLWDETVSAIEESISQRKSPRAKEHQHIVFITKYFRPWGSVDDRNCPISRQFRKLLDRCDLYQPGKSFYSLRHCFEDVAGDTSDQVAVDAVMGHDNGSMANVYRDRVKDHRLEKLADHVHTWLFRSGGLAK